MDEHEIEKEFTYRSEEVIRLQRFARRPKTTSTIINKLIAKRGFAATRSNEQLQEAWTEVVGSGIARQTRLGSIRKRVLQVYVASSAAKQHLSMIKAELVEDMKLKYSGIDDIRFKVGN